MIKSMTGFGRGQAENDIYRLTVEMRSVNHRFLELYTRLPRLLSSAEDALKKQIQAAFSRGKFDVFVTLEQICPKNTTIKVDKELAIAYHNALLELAECCNLAPSVPVQTVASQTGVLTVETLADDEDALASLLTEAAAAAIAQMRAMRQTEGEALAEDLLKHLAAMEKAAEEIATFAPAVVSEQKQRIEQRITELLSGVEIDQARLANEIAFFADRVDISEELTRLSSHLSQFRGNVCADAPTGRKLEFIQQEMLREINTIGSKSNALRINQIVIDVKSGLEKIREQIQNVE